MKPPMNENNMDVQQLQIRGKRKAERSPQKNEKVKRSALGNLTNNCNFNSNNNNNNINNNHGITKSLSIPLKAEGVEGQHHGPVINVNTETQDVMASKVIMTRARSRKMNNNNLEASSKSLTSNNKLAMEPINLKVIPGVLKKDTIKKTTVEEENEEEDKENDDDGNKENIINTVNNKIRTEVPAAPVLQVQMVPGKVQANNKPPARRISNQFNETEESVYMSALEDCSTDSSIRLSGNFESLRRQSSMLKVTTNKAQSNLAVPKRSSIILSNERIEKQTTDDDNVLNEKRPEKKEATRAAILNIGKRRTVPAGVEDFDQKLMGDPTHVAEYAMDIFEYLKEREPYYIISDYMPKQIELSVYMRTLLIDWMVEVQETFELNHETLYLAVKIVDLYLSRVEITKDLLQLLGATAFFIACKYDERTPPLIDDFLYICDGAYKHKQFVQMEIKILRTLDFDLGIPLSYRFLRRYARCNSTPMSILTLARYILETSLLDYDAIFYSDSKMAAAALYMAYRMFAEHERHNNQLNGSATVSSEEEEEGEDNNTNVKPLNNVNNGNKKDTVTATYHWNATLEYYSGYKLTDFIEMVIILNNSLNRQYKGDCIKTIRSKYSHKIFFEVAKINVLNTMELLQGSITAADLPLINTQKSTIQNHTQANHDGIEQQSAAFTIAAATIADNGSKSDLDSTQSSEIVNVTKNEDGNDSDQDMSHDQHN